MSDYRRWISYIYSYEHGEKRDNAGYARIELKDGRVKMTIYMTPGRKDGNVKVCFYKSQQGHLAGIPLGNLDLSVPSPVFRTETSASNVMESGLFFVEMNGLLLVKEDGLYYASSWEDEALEEDVARDIIRLLNGKQNENNGEKTKQTEGSKKETAQVEEGQKALEQIEKNEKETGKAGNKKEAMKAEIKEETEIAGSQKAQKKEAKEQIKQQEDVLKTKSLKIAEIKEMPKMANTAEEAGKQTEKCEKDKCEPESECGQESNGQQDSGCNQQAAKPEKEVKETKKTETTRTTETPYKNCCMGASPAERIFCCLPPMYPFEEAKYEKGVRMTPQDIGMLPRALWKLAGNSFLLHAYYTYHHLLFVKQRQKDEPLYFLMLPGVYSEKEQNLALMFGFCNFCAVKRKALEQGDFGYWYLEVNF